MIPGLRRVGQVRAVSGIWTICNAFPICSELPRLGSQLQVVQGLLLHVRQDVEEEPARLAAVETATRVAYPNVTPAARGQPADDVLVIQRRQAELLDVVSWHCAILAALARRLHRREQQRNQDADDRNHDQKLDERKTGPLGRSKSAHAAAPLSFRYKILATVEICNARNRGVDLHAEKTRFARRPNIDSPGLPGRPGLRSQYRLTDCIMTGQSRAGNQQRADPADVDASATVCDLAQIATVPPRPDAGT